MSCTHILPSTSSYTPPSMNSTLVLPYLFGLVLADHQYMAKSHIDVLLGVTVYTRILKSTFIKGNLDEPLATPSALDCWFTVQIPTTGIYRATDNSSFHPVQNCCIGKFLQIYRHHLQVIAPVKLLYEYRRKKCGNNFLLDQPTKFDKVKISLHPFDDYLTNHNDKFLHFQKYGC